MIIYKILSLDLYQPRCTRQLDDTTYTTIEQRLQQAVTAILPASANVPTESALLDIATKALTTNTSVGCTGCHLDHFQGDGSTARLAGQQHDYLLKTMTDFRARTRGNNPGMTDLMKSLTPQDIAALAAWLAAM